MTTTSTFQLRPPTEADIPALAELRNRGSLAINGTTITTEKQIQSEWNEPGYDPLKDSVVALNGEQRIVGEAALYVRPPYVVYYAGVSVHPDWKGQSIGTILTAWLEQTVRERFALAPAEARIALVSNIVSNDVAARQLLLEPITTVMCRFPLKKGFHVDGFRERIERIMDGNALGIQPVDRYRNLGL